MKGRKMNGLGVRYFLRRSSMNLSGSKMSAGRPKKIVRIEKLVVKEISVAYHRGPKDLCDGA